MYNPVAMNCVPSLAMVRKSLCPPLSMNVTPLRSTVHVRPFWDRCLFFQQVLSSATQGPTKRPSSVHLCSVVISAIVIRNISMAPVHHPVVDSSNTNLGPASIATLAKSRNLDLMRSVSGALAHMDFRPASFKMDIVHTRFHQQDAAPMFGGGVRCAAVAHHLSEVESFSLIGHDDRYFAAWPAAAADVYLCPCVLLVAVKDGISQCLAERQFDIELRSRNTLRSFNQPHQAVHQR